MDSVAKSPTRSTGRNSAGNILSVRRRSTFITYLAIGIGIFLVNGIAFSLIPEGEIRHYLAVGYLFQTGMFAFFSFARHDFLAIRLLQPSMITLIYVGLSCTAGAWAFDSKNVSNILGRQYYFMWNNLGDAYILISLCFLALYSLSLRNLGLPKDNTAFQNNIHDRRKSQIFLLLVLISCLALTINLKIGIISQIKTVIVASIFYVLFKFDVKYKWVLALLVIGILSSTSFHSKREAIFALPAMFLISLAYLPRTRISLFNLALGVVGFVFIVTLILAMSILREYGGFGAENIFEAITFIPDYVELPNSLAFIFNNFEVTYIFLHFHQCVSSILDSPRMMADGSTYARMLLIWPVGDLLGYKPPSIIEQYTGAFFPYFRDEGGSFGVTSIGEAVWNFGWLAPLALLAVYFGLDALFAKTVHLIRERKAWSTIVALTICQFSLYFSRGSGLDIFVIYVLFSVVSAYAITLLIAIFQAGDESPPKLWKGAARPRPRHQW